MSEASSGVSRPVGEKEAAFRSLRALKVFSESLEKGGRPVSRNRRLLQDALYNTVFGQAFEPILIERLLRQAQRRVLTSGSKVELKAAADGLYVLLGGSVDVMAVPKAEPRPFRIHVVSASNLPGGGGADILDPYVVVKIGNKQVQTQVFMDYGENPVFDDWSTVMVYDEEPEIEFHVMEYDQYSKHDCLGVAQLSRYQITTEGFDGTLPLSPLGETRETLRNSLGGLGHIKIRVEPEKMPEMSAGEDGDGASEAASSSMNSWKKKVLSSGKAMAIIKDVKEETALTALQPGDYFAMDVGGGVLRADGDAEFMFVPRREVHNISNALKFEQAQEKEEFLRQWLPSGQNLDPKTISQLASSLQEGVFPRGHVLCSAEAGAETQKRRVFLLMKGVVKTYLPMHKPIGPGSLKTKKKPISKQAPVGVLGKGAVVAYSSALFGLPEPFTVVADESITVLWASAEDGRLSWPRDVARALHESLKARTEWHGARLQHIANGHVAKREMEDADTQSKRELMSSTSPYLRHKELPSWQTKFFEDKTQVEEGWMPREDANSPPGPDRVSLLRQRYESMTLPSTSASSTGLSRPSTQSTSAAMLPSTPLGSSGSTVTSLPARCKTPWGGWIPSGTLSLPNLHAGMGGSDFRSSGSQGRQLSSHPKSGGASWSRPPMNLSCAGDFQRLSGQANMGAVQKMYAQQVRSKELGAPSEFAQQVRSGGK